MKLKETKHDYYMESSEHHSSFPEWNFFKETAFYQFNNYNFLVRYDIKKYEEEDKYYMELNYVLQRKGILFKVIIEELREDDMEDIERYLKLCWEYTKEMWKEIN